MGVSGESGWVGLGEGDEGGDEEESGAEEMVSLEDAVDELEAGITWTLDEAVDRSKLSASSKQVRDPVNCLVTCWQRAAWKMGA